MIAKVVRARLGELRLGEPRTLGPLGLVPLFGARPAPLAYELAPEAFAQGTLRVEERVSSRVNELAVSNAGRLPVLFLDGEYLEGGKQNRIVNVSAVVPAHASLDLPVSCVERGRWHWTTGWRTFRPSHVHTYSRLRAIEACQVAAAAWLSSAARAGQAGVWDEVARLHRSMGTASSDWAMNVSYDRQRAWIGLVLDEFPEPLADQCGVVVWVADEPVALEVFDWPATLAGAWPRLLTGYAMDAAAAHGTRARVDLDGVAAWIEQVRAAAVAEREPLGLGAGASLTGEGVVGGALVYGDTLIHLAAFAHERDDDRERTTHFHGAVPVEPRPEPRPWPVPPEPDRAPTPVTGPVP